MKNQHYDAEQPFQPRQAQQQIPRVRPGKPSGLHQSSGNFHRVGRNARLWYSAPHQRDVWADVQVPKGSGGVPGHDVVGWCLFFFQGYAMHLSRGFGSYRSACTCLAAGPLRRLARLGDYDSWGLLVLAGDMRFHDCRLAS
jgi:hypothetical protein